MTISSLKAVSGVSCETGYCPCIIPLPGRLSTVSLSPCSPDRSDLAILPRLPWLPQSIGRDLSRVYRTILDINASLKRSSHTLLDGAELVGAILRIAGGVCKSLRSASLSFTTWADSLRPICINTMCCQIPGSGHSKSMISLSRAQLCYQD